MAQIIFTKHALERIYERSFPKAHVVETIHTPDSVIAGKEKGTLEYRKKFEKNTITAIVGKGTKGEELILSCWVDPPVYGTRDYTRRERYKRYQKASFWGKVGMDILSIFGW